MRIFEIETEEIYSSDYSGCFPVSDPVDLSDDNTFYDGAIYGSGRFILGIMALVSFLLIDRLYKQRGE